jgi:hypothetical protein
MIGSFKVVLNELDETVRDSLKKTPKEHIFVAHMWATQKVKNAKTPNFMKL